eukprot:XP_011666930.1 PREDICTED: uncharacterized protein LOC105436454 [Strongylocentrotus purpuratus]
MKACMLHIMTVPSTGTSASNPPTESTSLPSSTPSSTEPDLDVLCSPTPCKNNGECQIDHNTFDLTCVCASGYSGPQCSNSSNVVLLVILVPITILILLFIIFFVVLVVYYRVRLHKLEGYKKRPFHYDRNARRYEDVMQQLYFTEDRRHQHQDLETFKNSAMGLRFSKEINVSSHS